MRQISQCSTKSNFVRAGTIVLAAQSALVFAESADALRQTHPAAATTPPVQTPRDSMSSWHFQAVYGIGYADFEIPIWKTETDPAVQDQVSTTGLVTQARYSHAIEHRLNQQQMFRWGFSLLNNQTTTDNGLLSSLARDSLVPAWRSWGVGCDLFIVRRFCSACDFDAGIQLDYHLSGNTTLRSSELSGSVNSPPSRLDQKSGWRVAFSGGISGLYLGPVGIVARLSGFVTQADFEGHSRPMRAQGLEVQLGANLALGRGE